MRVCVVGCGILGASVAFGLAEHEGVDVTAVDAATPGGGTTAVSFAWVNANGKRPRAYFELNHAGMREYDSWQHAPWLHRTGCLVTGEHVGDAAGLVQELRSWDYRAELTDVREANRSVEPALVLGDPDLPAVYFPDELCVDAVPLTRMLVTDAAARGASVHLGVPVTGVERGAAAFRVTLADGSSVHADAVVNATGPAAGAFGALAGSPVPLASTWGMTVVVHAPGHPVRGVVHTGVVDLRPEGPDHLRAHWTQVDERLGHPDTDGSALAPELLRRVRETVPSLREPHVAATYAGVRPIPADGVTSVGAVPGVTGLYEVVTHSGVTLGPLLGRLLADEIVHGRVDPMLAPFRPDRFPGR